MKAKFTAISITSMPDGKYVDPQHPGLNLWVRNGGVSRVWQMRYTFNGVARFISLGSLRNVSLAQARLKVSDYRAQIGAGIDPYVALKTEKTAGAAPPPAAGVTFKQDAETYFEYRHRKWSPEHAREWMGSLARHVFPLIGDRATAELTTVDVVDVLRPIWTEMNETAVRIHGRIRTIIDHAIEIDDARRFPLKFNVAEGAEKRLPCGVRPKEAPHPSMPWQAVPGLYARLHPRQDMPSKALAFLLLCCCPRANEVAGARWNEIDLDKAEFTVPADRMKSRKSRVIPLSQAAVNLLNSIRPVTLGSPDQVVFPSRLGSEVRQFSGHINGDAMRLILQRGLNEPFAVHGFRASLRDWTLDTNPADLMAVELALDHRLGNAVQEAYRRTDLMAARRALAERWATHLGASGAGALAKAA